MRFTVRIVRRGSIGRCFGRGLLLQGFQLFLRALGCGRLRSITVCGGLCGKETAPLRQILDTLRETYCGRIGPEYMHIAKELKVHAGEELAHALTIAKQIDYLGGSPTVTPKAVKTSDDPKAMLKFDLENERVTIREYRRRVVQAEAIGEFAVAEHLRAILRDEQEHLTDLAEALDIDPPDPGIA